MLIEFPSVVEAHEPAVADHEAGTARTLRERCLVSDAVVVAKPSIPWTRSRFP